MAKVLTFGEIMLRLSPPGHERFLQSPAFVATFGGGEANVAVSLAHFGLESWYVTRLPANPIGDAAVRALRAEGVRTDAIVRGGDRIGIYFAENGASQRPSAVVYDRAHSAIAEIGATDVDWPRLCEGGRWLHVTGITPALGPRAAEATRAALDAARNAGLSTSIDLNYRKKLWTPHQAQTVMRALVRGADVVIANEEDLQHVLGVTIAGADVASGQIVVDAYAEAAATVAREFEVGRIAITLRESVSASVNGWHALLWSDAAGALHRSQRYDLSVVDRIGGGDSFAAGLIYGIVAGLPDPDALRFAVAASALKHSIPGDFNRVTIDEVSRLAAGDGSGRVQR